MTALKVVHPTQPYGPQAALLAKRADVVGATPAAGWQPRGQPYWRF